ncbi:MAG TPA: hypothetical protein VIM98_09805 [Dyella sp.]|uniref:cupredoxin domain-containing protein n=1 Tax=Dyella sp. TaxID=1869338 RepID=UPI002F9379D2
MRIQRFCLAIALGILAAAAHAVGADISGHVELAANPGQTIAPGELVDTLVYFVPKSGVPRIHPGTYTVYSVNMDFRPGAMAVPVGSTVKFANLDQVLHNVYSSTPGAVFDHQFQKVGDVVEHRFAQPGTVLVSCNVHHFMEFDLLVVPTPYMAAVTANGSFVLHGVPPGPGTLYFWNPRGSLRSQAVNAPQGDIAQRLVAIKSRVATELHRENQR